MGFVGMGYSGATNWISADHTSTSLLDDIAPGVQKTLPITRSKWLSLIADSALQSGRTCPGGFNVFNWNNAHKRRIGVTANNENQCSTQDSSLGMGGNYQRPCGNYCSYSCGKDYRAMCYVLVQ